MSFKLYDYLEKKRNIGIENEIAFNKTMAMFKYHNLPDSIPCYELENLLQKNGFACVAKVESELYAFDGGLGGEPDVYYRPTICTVANPALNLNKNFVIDKDCVIVKNDSNLVGLSHTISKYNSLITENEITILIALINSRMSVIFSGSDSATKTSAEQYLSMIKQGKLGVISDNAFLESLSINMGNNTRNNVFEDLIRLNMYLKASLNNAIGLNSNTAMKKERLITAEIDVNNTSLYPLIDDMLECRRIGVEKINELFGTEITVELNSSWDYRQFNGMSIHNTDSEVDLEDIQQEDNSDNENNENNLDNDSNDNNPCNLDNNSNADNPSDEDNAGNEDNAINENNEDDSGDSDDDSNLDDNSNAENPINEDNATNENNDDDSSNSDDDSKEE